MNWIDWAVVWIFLGASLGLGILFTRRANKSLESYFVSNRQLSWWLAGTSMAATAFSSDTPLLVTGMVRRRGIWGTWEILALGISTMLAVFVFAKLWKRANVVTEVELVERRYSGNAAAFLRGFKAIYWGVFYNCFVMGAWPILGMTKVLQEVTGVSKESAVLFSVVLGTSYTAFSGLWGVVLTDAFQFLWAMFGAVWLAWCAVQAVGGLDALTAGVPPGALAVIPPGPTGGEALASSPLGWFLGLLCIQWWAWKNTDGGGVIVQRLVSCKDERQAMYSVLWFNLAQYCLRAWPWILTALASMMLVPDEALRLADGAVDHERAYPRLILLLLPEGLRGIMIAAFFAAFLSTISTQLNWGASYLINDCYKRFIRPRATDKHYLAVSRMIPFGLAAGAVGVAYSLNSIGDAFTLILNLTAGIGPVYLLRWFWWRVNAWSEIGAMLASVPVLLLRPWLIARLGLPAGLPTDLLVMILGSAAVWLPATLLTPAVDRGTLKAFYHAVQPPGWWAPVSTGIASFGWGASLRQWLVSTVALMATALGPLQWMLGQPTWGITWCAVAAVGWLWLIRTLRRSTI